MPRGGQTTWRRGWAHSRAWVWFGHLGALLRLSFGLRDGAGKIGMWPFVSCNSEDIRRTTFLEPKTAENRELALRHLVNRLVPENA